MELFDVEIPEMEQFEEEELLEACGCLCGVSNGSGAGLATR